MPRYLLDTNHLSPLVTHGHPLRARILRQLDMGDEFAIPMPVLTEFLYGIRIAPRADANNVEWRELEAIFAYYSINKPEAEEAADLQIVLRRRGRQLATVDALIAVIAIRNGLILLTTDRDFETIPHLQYENWLRS